MHSMGNVGADGRISYYQMTGDEVIADLHSHRYGLTHPEARRRRKQNGLNRLGSSASTSAAATGIIQPWLVGLLLVGALLAWYTSDATSAAVLIVGLLAIIVADTWREHRSDTLAYRLRQQFPARATVRRNDVLEIIPASQLVIGDIVELEPGARVPADLRLLEVDNLCVDEALLFNVHEGHAHKFSHALTGNVILPRRHNLAFAGTAVTAGSGNGVVIATGMQTELGRILAQAAVVTPKRSFFQHMFMQYSRRFGVAALLLLGALGVLTAGDSLDTSTAASFALALVIALTPIELVLAVTGMFRGFVGRAKYRHVRGLVPSASDRLGHADIMLIDEADFVINPAQTVGELLVGKALYKAEPTGYSPAGKILTAKGKPVSMRALADLQLVFDAMVLSSRAKLLPPDGDNRDWHVAGPSSEGALLALAAKAGIDIEATRQKYPIVARYTYDQVRQLTSGLHQYDHRQMLFVHGEATAVAERATHIWDDGHTRKLTVTERARLHAYQETQAARGNHTIALAYRHLPKFSSEPLDMEQVEQELVLLGIASVTQPMTYTAPLAAQTAHGMQIALSVCSQRPARAALSVAEQFGLDRPLVITSDSLHSYDDAQLLERLVTGNTVFLHLTPDQRLRLADIVARSEHHLAATGSSVSDVPALRHATVGITGDSASLVVREQADLVLPRNDLHELTRLLSHSRQLSAHVRHIMQNALVNHSTQLWLVATSLGMYIYGHVPLATTASLYLAATLLQVLPFAATIEDPSDRFETKQGPDDLPPHSSLVNGALGAFAALLICTNFLFFFVRAGLSPRYIDSLSNIYAQAATLSFVTLVLCMYINLLFARAQHTDNMLSKQLRNSTLVWVFLVGMLIAGLLAYNPTAQSFMGTSGLGLVDWLSALLVAGMYFFIRWLAHTSRRHSRRVVVSELLRGSGGTF